MFFYNVEMPFKGLLRFIVLFSALVAPDNYAFIFIFFQLFETFSFFLCGSIGTRPAPVPGCCSWRGPPVLLLGSWRPVSALAREAAPTRVCEPLAPRTGVTPGPPVGEGRPPLGAVPLTPRGAGRDVASLGGGVSPVGVGFPISPCRGLDTGAGSSGCVFWVSYISFARLAMFINKCVICGFAQSTFDLNPYVTGKQCRPAQLVTAPLRTSGVRGRTRGRLGPPDQWCLWCLTVTAHGLSRGSSCFLLSFRVLYILFERKELTADLPSLEPQ